MDSALVNELFNGDINSCFDAEFGNNMDSIDWNRMFDEGMKAYDRMDSEQLDELMNSLDMSGFEKIMEELDVDKLMEDMELLLPNLDSLIIEKSQKKKEDKNLKRI